MRPLLILVALGSALALGAGVALTLGSSVAQTRSEPHGAVAPGRVGGDLESTLGQVLARLEKLEGNVTMLSTQVAQAREAASRAPAAALVEAAREEVGMRTPPALDAAAIERAFVLRVVEEERQRQEEERAAERLQREEERIRERAEKIALDLGLAPADQNRLATLMVDATAKRNELFTAMREDGFTGDRETMRAAFTELQDSYTSQLNEAFGETLGAQIAEASNIGGGGRRGGFGGGGFGGGGGGAQGGTTSGAPGGAVGGGNRRSRGGGGGGF